LYKITYQKPIAKYGADLICSAHFAIMLEMPGNRHHRTSLRTATGGLGDGTIIRIDNQTQTDYKEIGHTSPLKRCMPDCGLYNKRTGTCEATGNEAPNGNNCEAQVISRGERFSS